MPIASIPWIVFTDLDGSLLDHDNYSCAEARPALELIRREQIPLIFASSKTRAEIEMLQAAMGVREPFIVENGGGLFFPDGYRGYRIDAGFRRPPYTVIELGASYGEIRRFVYSLKTRFRIKGFGDLSAEEVQRLSGLPPRQVGWARQREYSEPFVIDDEAALGELKGIVEARGYQITRGGRFFHLTGLRQDKGLAVRMAAEIIARNAEKAPTTVGLGDSPNDFSMLANVDIPILIPRPDGSYAGLNLPHLRRAAHPGSRGWNEALLGILGGGPT